MIATAEPLDLGKKYSKLFKDFEVFELNDIYTELEKWQHEYMSSNWEQFGRHLERLQNYLYKSGLDEAKKHVIQHSIDLQRGTYLTGMSYPERRQFINEKDRLDLTSRRTQLMLGHPFNKEEKGWLADKAAGKPTWEINSQKIIKELDTRIEVLDVKRTQPNHILNLKKYQKTRLSAFHEKILLRAHSVSYKSKVKNSHTDTQPTPTPAVRSLASLCLPAYATNKYKREVADITKRHLG